MRVISFTKSATVNNKEYKKGDELRVSSSIFDRLVNVEKIAVEKTKKAKKD